MANVNPELEGKVKSLETVYLGLKVHKLTCNKGSLEIEVS